MHGVRLCENDLCKFGGIFVVFFGGLGICLYILMYIYIYIYHVYIYICTYGLD